MQCVWDKSEQNVMNIDINDIKSFITVAELKSISGAAHKLNYLQSNMTAKVKKIKK